MKLILSLVALFGLAVSCSSNRSSGDGANPNPQGSTQAQPSTQILPSSPSTPTGSQLPQTTAPSGSSIPPSPANLGADCYKGEPLICQIENLIVQKTNKLRGSRAPLAGHAHMSFVARKWSDTQASRGRIGHDGFPRQRAQVYSSEFGSSEGVDMSAENVAMSGGGEETAEEVAEMFADMWWNSPGHRANMLGNYDLLGVGVSRKGSGWYATQIFGSR